MLNHMISIANRDGTRQWQSATSFDDPPHPDKLQRLADLTGRSVKHQRPSKKGSGMTESYYHPATDEKYKDNKRLIIAVVEGRV